MYFKCLLIPDRFVTLTWVESAGTFFFAGEEGLQIDQSLPASDTNPLFGLKLFSTPIEICPRKFEKIIQFYNNVDKSGLFFFFFLKLWLQFSPMYFKCLLIPGRFSNLVSRVDRVIFRWGGGSPKSTIPPSIWWHSSLFWQELFPYLRWDLSPKIWKNNTVLQQFR